MLFMFVLRGRPVPCSQAVSDLLGFHLLLLVEGLLSFTSPLDIVIFGVHTLVLLSGTDQNIGQRAFHNR